MTDETHDYRRKRVAIKLKGALEMADMWAASGDERAGVVIDALDYLVETHFADFSDLVAPLRPNKDVKAEAEAAREDEKAHEKRRAERKAAREERRAD